MFAYVKSEQYQVKPTLHCLFLLITTEKQGINGNNECVLLTNSSIIMNNWA